MIIIINNILLPLISYNFNIDGEIINKIRSTNEFLKTSEVSGKIFINGTSDWVDFKNAGKCSGEGTYSIPYVIEDLVIDGGNILMHTSELRIVLYIIQGKAFMILMRE
jgi:hypothetical protein